MPTLKRWLECHGQKKTGNLSALVERVRGCIALKLNVDQEWMAVNSTSSNLKETA